MTEVDLITTFWRTASGTSQRWLSSRQQGACSMLVKSYIASMSQSKVLCGRVIIELNEVTARELQPAITVLQLFLSSSKPTLRFAAIRALNKVAMVHPLSVTSCNIDMESLISDQNRSIRRWPSRLSSKPRIRSSVDRLMKQITAFMSDIQVCYNLSLDDSGCRIY